MYNYTILNNNNIFDICAKAASRSYNINTENFSPEEREQYVKKIWDVHTNVSEHANLSIYFYDIPRWATFLMALQRFGFTMTELSQRRNIVSDNSEYLSLVSSGIVKEDARKVLDLNTKTECVVTLNRESAKNIFRIFKKFAPNLEPLPFNEIFYFEYDNKEPIYCPEKIEIIPEERKIIPEEYVIEQKENNCYQFCMPVYSAHQFFRHRTIDILECKIYSNSDNLPQIKNLDTIYILARSFYWKDFIKTRSTKQTQEPLRTIAKILSNKSF